MNMYYNASKSKDIEMDTDPIVLFKNIKESIYNTPAVDEIIEKKDIPSIIDKDDYDYEEELFKDPLADE